MTRLKNLPFAKAWKFVYDRNMKTFTKKLASLILCMSVISMQNLCATEQEPGIDDRSQARVPLQLQAEGSTSAVELPWYKKKKFWIGATVVAATTAIATTAWAISKSSCDTSPAPSSLSSFGDDEDLFPAKQCYNYIIDHVPEVVAQPLYDISSSIYAYGRAMVTGFINFDWSCKYFGFDVNSIQYKFHAVCCYNPRFFSKSMDKSVILDIMQQKWNCSKLTTDKMENWFSFACISDN